MATHDPMVDEYRNPAIVRDLDSALAEAYGLERLDEALKVIAEHARLMIGAHQVALSYIPDGNFKAAVHAISLSDKYEKYRSYDVMPSGVGIWTLVIEHKVSFCMTQEELIRDPRWKNFSDLKDARGMEHPPMRGWLAVPILTRRGDFVGLLQSSDKYEDEFTERDLALLTHLAKLVAPTLELQLVNTELQQRSEDLAAKQNLLTKLLDLQEQERQMVAHDIHDGFVQDVVGAHMHVQSIHGAMDPERVQSILGRVAALLQKAIAEGRRLIRDLRPMILDEFGVVDAIAHLIADEERNDGFTVAFTHDVKFGRLDPRLEGAIFRIVQEALINAKRHGQSNHAAVHMTQMNDTLQVVIRDHGVGFDPAHVSPDRFGLRGICERAHIYCGTVIIESVPTQGTSVKVQLPLTSHVVGNVR